MADDRAELFARSTRMALSFARAAQDGDRGAVRRLTAELAELRRESADFPEVQATLDVLDRGVDLMAVHERGEDPAEALRRFTASADGLPAGHRLRAEVDDSSRMLEAYLGQMRGDGPGPVSAGEQIAAMADRPGLSPSERAFYLAGAGGLGFGPDADPALVSAGVEQLRAAVRLAPAGDPRRTAYLVGLATGLIRRNELTGGLADVDDAGRALDEARELAGGPHHPQWAMINEMLSHVRRRHPRAPDRPHPAPPDPGQPGGPRPAGPDSGSYALDGLRGYTWQALVQPDLAAANAAVRDAAGDAVDVARLFLNDGDPARAISALDAGRGLALFAANQTRSVPDRLDRAGRPELARQWRAASAAGRPDDLSSELRAQVWTALSGSGANDPLDVPGLDEIRAALALVDADALVYLVPGRGYAPGHAVIAAVGGPPSYLVLPDLRVEAGLDVERYLIALARRDRAREAGDGRAAKVANTRDLGAAGPEEQFARSLDELCDWAWRAAIGPLIETYLPRLRRRRVDRVPRVVLVPMGELAWVPWQAARRADGTYAVQLVALSQTASARMLCHSAGLTPVPAAPVGLVVGDPDPAGQARDLRAARLEAIAVHRSFYRGARYVGRRVNGSPGPSGSGAAGEIRDWLADARPGAGAMLHLACHGVLQAGAAATSYLLLAGGSRLSAGEVIEVMGRAPDRAVGLVVLAACRTGRAINSYDEAYSLGTAFLAGGARTVLSTQWSIPDGATSVLMFMTHYFLMARGMPARQALREAQLWMLDRDREPPASMPADLTAQLDETDPAEVMAWAGFIHGGQ